MFNKINRDVDHNDLLTCPDSVKLFDIHIYASIFKIGSVINQEVKPIAFYSIKLTGTPKGYTVTENNY